MYLLSCRFAVTSVMLEPFLEGQTMDTALAANRIFIVDLEILSRLKLDENKKVGHGACKGVNWRWKFENREEVNVSPGALNENILPLQTNMVHLRHFCLFFWGCVPLG